MEFIRTDNRAEQYQNLDWSKEYRKAQETYEMWFFWIYNCLQRNMHIALQKVFYDMAIHRRPFAVQAGDFSKKLL